VRTSGTNLAREPS